VETLEIVKQVREELLPQVKQLSFILFSGRSKGEKKLRNTFS